MNENVVNLDNCYRDIRGRRDKQTDRQTDRHADTLIVVLRNLQGAK